MFIKFKRLNKDTILPKYAHPGDAGMDLYSREEKTLKPKERFQFSLGFSLELPKGYVSLIWDKSGLANNYGVHSLAGVIDAGYRGEYKLVLINLSDKNYKVEKGDKVAQLLIQPVANVKIKEVDELSDTSRADGGFGSTGRK